MSRCLMRLVFVFWIAGTIAGCGAGAGKSQAPGDGFDGVSRPVFDSYVKNGQPIHFAELKNRHRLILFIHGSPGGWQDYSAYLADPQLQQRAHLISVDRPGFGQSGAGRAIPDIRTQAALLEPLLARAGGAGRPLLVGHSLGGTIAARMAMDFPDQVGALLLISAALDPALEAPRWYNRLAAVGLIEWLLPKELITSNQEMMPLSLELEKMLPLWKRIRVPVRIIQGEEDELVDPATVKFAERMLPGTPLQIQRFPGEGHFILWERPGLIREAILKLLEKLDEGAGN